MNRPAMLRRLCLAATLSGAATEVDARVEQKPDGPASSRPTITMTVKPASTGSGLVRTSLLFPEGFLCEGQGLVVDDGQRRAPAAVRVLTWHASTSGQAKSARRALVTFPYAFSEPRPFRFSLSTGDPGPEPASEARVGVNVTGTTIAIVYPSGPRIRARLVAPETTVSGEPRIEVVESNGFFRWRRIHTADVQWPRVLEIREDALGTVVVVAHLQRRLEGDGRAPDFGWEISFDGTSPWRFQLGDRNVDSVSEPIGEWLDGKASPSLSFGKNAYRLYHPTAVLKRKGRIQIRRDGDVGVVYRYLRCAEAEKVPMQEMSWQRAEFVVGPIAAAPLTPTFAYPHEMELDRRLANRLHGMAESPDVSGEPELASLVKYHREAIVRSMAHGDDWGNVTAYSDDARTGAVFGMNRLNHCPPIFEPAIRANDAGLREVALLWCDNFHDQSIWWGENRTGGTRYPNVIATGQAPPDNDQSYMWRSNDAVDFCTKGYDSFFMAFEETGDPRMLEALEAQVRYAAENVHADRGECRNVGDVRDFVRLYAFTGERRYLDQALRLFRELRTKLSTGDLFSQSGKPIEPHPPFINDDETGYRYPFAKPYIVGYALAGLPLLARHAPDEPKLRDVIRAVADFLADSQDPLGGWRYPHPRSANLPISMGMENAWHLVQADRLLGPDPKHLDAIERVLRQRIHGRLKTGRVFSSLTPWELATGKVKSPHLLAALYQSPADRDSARDYTEGRPEFGYCTPEGLVYFEEVLGFYLKHRPASALMRPPKGDEPLGKVLSRVPGAKK